MVRSQSNVIDTCNTKYSTSFGQYQLFYKIILGTTYSSVSRNEIINNVL